MLTLAASFDPGAGALPVDQSESGPVFKVTLVPSGLPDRLLIITDELLLVFELYRTDNLVGS
jgi:hypothetical protein